MCLKPVLLCLFVSLCSALQGLQLNETVEQDVGFWKRSGDSVKFFLYNRQRLNTPELLELNARRRSLFTSFSNNRPTKIIIHGWMGSDDKRFAIFTREALLARQDVNAIVVDWSNFGSKLILYPMARAKVPQVARLVADFLDNLNRQHGIRLENVHVLGHSLGAHIAGIAGNLVKTGKIGRITGLDPAAPLFSEKKPGERLSPSSALFVDVIHTCGHYLGYHSNLGHADFYPNGGDFIQPGCGVDIPGSCSHRRAYFFYIQSISNRNAFPAMSCHSWDDFKNKRNCGKVVNMGEGLDHSARGQFYLYTNDKEPFVGHL